MDRPPLHYEGLPVADTLHQIFEQVVQKHPYAIALQFLEKNINYQQLNEQANQLAHLILSHQPLPQALILISMDRSPEMIVSILAVIKAGCAYVPVDPNSPANRISYVLKDTNSNLLLTQKKFEAHFKNYSEVSVITVDGQWNSDQLPLTNPGLKIRSQDLAYCIYTSGSTGRPKGVLIEHRNAVNLIKAEQQFFNHPIKRFLFAYSFIFDGSVLLIFRTLLEGATLIIAEDGCEKDILKLSQLIAKTSVSHLLTFPSLYSILLENTNPGLLSSLESVSVAGEACPGALVRLHHQRIPHARLFNQYGPTEATVGTTIHQTTSDHHTPKTPIGTCIHNAFIHLLDEDKNQVESGSIGEIYIGGAGVSRGYLNQEELTREKFIQNPFGDGRLYRTGDLARQLPDGQYDFVGREDFQIKLRGYRIEPGEIEALILQDQKIREGLVLLHGEIPENQKLVAYLVHAKSQQATAAEIQSHLKDNLPGYMIPEQFIFIDKMPLTAAGKIDRTALPDPETFQQKSGAQYTKAASGLEKWIAESWTRLLNVKEIGTHDKFFELGGNSLLAARFISEIQQKIGENIFITSLFEHPTIASFATMLQKDYQQVLEQLDINKSNKKHKAKLLDSDFKDFENLIPVQAIKTPNKTKNPPAIFILAPPRSGTSLLRVMLAGHPNIFAANELQLLHFNTMEERATAYKGKFSLWKEGAVRAVMELKNIGPEDAQQLIDTEEQKATSTLAFYHSLQEMLNGKILLDKSPSYLLDPAALQRAEQIFENALYIHLYRHPYSMITSFEKMHMDQVMYLHDHNYSGRQLGELIWQQSHKNAIDFLKDIPKNRQFHLAYERLVTAPEQVMRDLSAHFDLPFNQNVLSPYQDLSNKMTDGLYKDSKAMGDPKLLQHGKIKASLADKWKGVKDDNFLHQSTWQLTEQLGYEPLSGAVPMHSMPDSSSDDIAIIGMAGRFPGAKDLDEFWQNLIGAKDVSRVFSDEELAAEGVEDHLINDPNYTKRGMYLNHADCFDAEFFGYLPKEAALMDPQHRIYLECAYSALEDAGYDPEKTKLNIGVFGGVARNTYLINNVITHPEYFKSIDDFQLGITLEKDFPSTRVAYKLNLKGPAVNVQTACSTSGVAVHLACQSILSGDADIIIVGGGRIQPPLASGHLHKEGHALSPDGYCRTFDTDANGMVRGQGMAFIVLKKRQQAIADGDHIHAVIKGTAINNDGDDKVGFTAPSVSGQSAAIIKAYQKAEINPESISYIEAHGTGTAIGDPIEIAGLSKAFKTFTDRKAFCHIGSVKANIGHLDAGACVAGIIKTVLALQHEMLPPLMHFNKPNPQINFADSPFIINKKPEPWKRSDQPRRAGISSFGLGGTNAHIVLEEAPQIEPITDYKTHELILLSAKKESTLRIRQNQLADYLAKHDASLNAVSYTLQTGKKHFLNRTFLTVKNREEAIQSLNDPDALNQVSGTAIQKNSGIVFMFPGGGSQHTFMGFELFKQEPVFKNAVLECLQILKKEHQLDLLHEMYPEHSDSMNQPIRDPLFGITSLFTVEYATAKLWQSWGIEPSELIGHSLGEYTAACISGVFSLREALALVAKRGKLFLKLEKGAMLSAAISAEQAKHYLNKELSLAAINRPNNCVFSGTENAIDALQFQLETKDIQSSKLHISVAAHSVMVESILEEFESFLNEIIFSPPKIPIISNVTGDYADEKEIQSPAYWLKHLRQTVRFSEGIEKLLEQDNKVLLEVGPGQTLSTFARQHPAKKSDQIIQASMRHPKEKTHDYAFILKTIGQLWIAGLDITWSTLHHNKPVRKVSLPTYPFERKKYWISPKQTTEIETSSEMKQEEQQTNTNTRLTKRALIIRDLKEIFHQLSGIESNQLNDRATFLEMGFDSLFLTQAVARIKKKLAVKISFRQLFEEAPNFIALADLIEQQLSPEAYQQELDQINRQHETPLIQNPESVASVTKVNFHLPTESLISELPADGSLQRIIQQQLQLMQQQLALLQGQKASTGNAPVPPSITPAPASAPLAEPKEKEKDTSSSKTDSTAHGPWRPINKKDNSGLTEQHKKYLAQLIEQYTTRTKGSQTLTQKQRKHLADPRSVTGFNRLWKDMVYQIAVDRSKGSKVWDIDGNQYIDYRNAFGISLFGHTPDFIQEAIQKQLQKGIELGVLTPLAEKVASLLCELSGCERATLVNTGSEALVAAVRAARTVTMKDKIIVFEGDYHGIADELLVRAVKTGNRTKAMPVAPGIPVSAVQNIIILNYDDPDVLRKVSAHLHEVAAVLIEPVQPNHPTRQPFELFKEIRKLTEANDVALIFDEMITGFRIALRGAQEWYGVEADLIAYGKVISGGLPMAAVAGKAKYMDAFDGGQWNFGDDSYPEAGVTFFGGTFVKHPLSLASAYAALSEIKKQGPDLYKRLNEKSARFAEQLKVLFLKTKAPLVVQSTASIVSIQLTSQDPLAQLIFYYLRLKGIHIKEKAALISIEHSEEDLNFTVKMFEESIKEMQTAGFFKITVAEVVDHNMIAYPPSHQTLPASVTPPFFLKTLPLTDGQKEIWVEQQLGTEAAAAYNLGTELHIKGVFEVVHFENAFQKLVQRHEALRTSFSKTETSQKILDDRKVKLPVIDISGYSLKEQTEYLDRLRYDEGATPIDIFNEIPFRVQLIKVSDLEHYCFFTVHHMIADGWSMGLLLKDLAQLFTAESNNTQASLSEAAQLSNFIKTQQATITASEVQSSLEYWTNQFNDAIPILEFPTDRSRPKLKTYASGMEHFTIAAPLFDRLKQTALMQKTSFFSLIYTAFQVFIHRLSHQEDFVLGITSAAQAKEENPHLVMHGVNLLPIRVQTNPDDSFSDILKRTQNKIFDANEHQAIAFGTLVKKLQVPRDPARTPLMSILFNMDAPMEDLHFGNLDIQTKPIQRHFETFDIFINIKPASDHLKVEWIYNKDLFYPETIQRRLQEFETLLTSISNHPTQAVSDLNILPEFEKQLLIHEWNDTIVQRPKRLIHQYLEEQAVTTPDAIAVSDTRLKVSYHEFNQEVNQLARHLTYSGIQSGNFVGIFLERSVDMIKTLLACMKIGVIYVPLDPLNPSERLKVIVEDAQAAFLITQNSLSDRSPGHFKKVINLDQDKEEIESCTTENLQRPIQPDQLVYVNYTSGSTGKPKGVLIPHYAVIDHHLAIINALNLNHTDKIFSVASIAFDPSVQDFFLPLMIGAEVYISGDKEKTDGFQLKAALEKEQPTLMQATPSTWRMLLSAGWQGHKALTILSGGEGLTKELSGKLVDRSNQLYNIYGPTETTIWSTLKLLKGDRSLTKTETSYEPIGRPIENVQVYVLDKKLKPVPIGVAGEIYIGGVGVAPGGYFKRADLSNEKFVDNPFNNTPGEKLYRTGDLARYLNNGDLEYLNRVDTQVKIRGFRIEIGEIESAIAGYETVGENVVLIREDQKDHKQLVAYCIPQNGKPIIFAELKKYLKSRLPEYMVPSSFVQLEQFPLTATMKIDRNKLPKPDLVVFSKEKNHIEASSENEQMIENIWKAVLPVEQISMDDDFFELGGHSLIAVDMISRIEQQCGKQIPLASLLENSTIRKLAALLEDDKKIEQSTQSSLVPIKTEGKRTPIFLVHGAGLHVLMFQTLAANLDEDQPIYALQAKGLNGGAEPFTKMEDIAAHYIKEIETVHPEGPYVLAGYSFGGLIAFEMAKQLKTKGKTIRMLAMFDTIVHENITGDRIKNKYYKRLATLGKKVAWNISLLAKDPVPNIKYKSQVLKRRYQRWTGPSEEKDFTEANSVFGGKVDQANKQAFENYRISPYQGKIHLFRARSQRFYLNDFEYLGWKPYALGGVELHEVPGDHLTLFDPPHGARFAKILQSCLNKIQTEQTKPKLSKL